MKDSTEAASVFPRLLSPMHAAELLDCSRTHIYGLIAAGKLRAVEIKAHGRSKTRIRAEDLEEFIEANTRRATTRGGGVGQARPVDGM